jgi:large subunit ribosomal protein L11
MIKKAAGIASGAGMVGSETAGKLSKDKLREIAEVKLPDLNTSDVEMAMNIIAGSARSMGVEIVD